METTTDLQTQPLRGELFAAACPSRQVLKALTSQWGVLVLCALMTGVHRFSELRNKMEGVSEKMLSQTLKSLENHGFVQRTAHPVIPPHVDYALTPLGHEAAQHVKTLASWIEDKLPDILGQCPAKARE